MTYNPEQMAWVVLSYYGKPIPWDRAKRHFNLRKKEIEVLINITNQIPDTAISSYLPNGRSVRDEWISWHMGWQAPSKKQAINAFEEGRRIAFFASDDKEEWEACLSCYKGNVYIILRDASRVQEIVSYEELDHYCGEIGPYDDNVNYIRFSFNDMCYLWKVSRLRLGIGFNEPLIKGMKKFLP